MNVPLPQIHYDNNTYAESNRLANLMVNDESDYYFSFANEYGDLDARSDEINEKTFLPLFPSTTTTTGSSSFLETQKHENESTSSPQLSNIDMFFDYAQKNSNLNGHRTSSLSNSPCGIHQLISLAEKALQISKQKMALQQMNELRQNYSRYYNSQFFDSMQVTRNNILDESVDTSSIKTNKILNNSLGLVKDLWENGIKNWDYDNHQQLFSANSNNNNDIPDEANEVFVPDDSADYGRLETFNEKINHYRSFTMSLNPETNIGKYKRYTALFNKAKAHRNAAHNVQQTKIMSWNGQLPIRQYSGDSKFSTKIFIGGVPWELTEAQIVEILSRHGKCRVEPPTGNSKMHSPHSQTYPGFVYVIYEDESEVKSLLRHCLQDKENRFFYTLPVAKRSSTQGKQVQVIPWDQKDVIHYNGVSNVMNGSRHLLDLKKTVFVGALHGMITARALACIMSDLFGQVIYAAIDTDKYKYPIGSGRVMFSSRASYEAAIRTQFVRIKTEKIEKTIQIDPYLYDEPCSICSSLNSNQSEQEMLAFCRECLTYFCSECWYGYHSLRQHTSTHIPLMRIFRSLSCPGSTMFSTVR